MRNFLKLDSMHNQFMQHYALLEQFVCLLTTDPQMLPRSVGVTQSQVLEVTEQPLTQDILLYNGLSQTAQVNAQVLQPGTVSCQGVHHLVLNTGFCNVEAYQAGIACYDINQH